MANNILVFAPTDTGTNLLTQAEYLAATDRTIGNQPGVASSKLVNKVLRQCAFIASQIAQFIADRTGEDVLDDGDTAVLLANMKLAFSDFPIVDEVSGTGAISAGSRLVLATGNITLTLPTLASSIGSLITVKAVGVGTNFVTVDGNGAEKIDQNDSVALAQEFNESIKLFNYDGSVWLIVP